jgi:hypothetical protein
LPRLGIRRRHLPLKIATRAEQGSPHHYEFSRVYTDLRFVHGFQPSVCIRVYDKIVQATNRSHNNIMRMSTFSIYDKAKADIENTRGFKLGGGQAYDRSSD